MQKTAWENNRYSKKDDDFENRPSCKGYSLGKNGQFGSNIKIQKKHAKNDSLITLELFCSKTRLRKHQIFDKWDDFKNRSSCKGYSLGKNGQFGSKVKIRKKTCEKRFFNHITVVPCKKPLEKTPNIQQNETILKIGHRAKAIALAKWSVLVKN